MDLAKAKTKPLGASPNHERLAKLAGSWAGPVKTWLAPDGPPEESAWIADATVVMGGRYLLLDYAGTVQGEPHVGELILGYDTNEDLWTAAWIDSFHTQTAIMPLTGPGGDAIAMKGTFFAGPGPRWGWGIELAGGAGELVVRMTIGTPDGLEKPALEARLAAKKPAAKKPAAKKPAAKKPAAKKPAAKKKLAKAKRR